MKVTELVINGCLDHDTVTRLGQRADDLTESGNNTSKFHEPFLLGRKAVISLHKSDDCIKIRFRWTRIAKDGGIEIFLKPLHNFGSVFKFHIRNRKRNNVIGNVGNDFFHRVPFERANVISFNQGFKIVFHQFPTPSDLSTPS